MQTKLARYAEAGIPELWIVNLAGGMTEHHTSPSGDLYGHVHLARRGEKVEFSSLPGLNVRVDDVLGPKQENG